MIGNISCGGSFGKETKYEMNRKKGRAAKYESQKTEAEKTAASEIKEPEIKVNQIDDDAIENSIQTKAKKKIAGTTAANEKENLARHDNSYLIKKTNLSSAPGNFNYKPEASEKLENVVSASQTIREKAAPYHEGERHRIIATNVAGETPNEIAAHLKAVAEQNPKISKPAVKISISASKNDNVTVAQWREIGKGALKELGYENSPFSIIQHRDREHDHIHILTSKVDIFGRTVDDSQSKMKLENYLRETEIKYGFEITQSSQETLRAAPKRGEARTVSGKRRSFDKNEFADKS